MGARLGFPLAAFVAGLTSAGTVVGRGRWSRMCGVLVQVAPLIVRGGIKIDTLLAKVIRSDHELHGGSELR